MRIIFMGTPNFGIPLLEQILKSKHELVLIISQPDRKINRKGKVIISEVKKFAINQNIEIIQPKNINLITDKIKSYNPDLIITAAYGQFISDDILNLAKFGAINFHGSLLPKYRGGAPIHHAILNNEKQTGISVIFMTNKMDAGDIIYQSKINIAKYETTKDIYTKLANLNKEVFLKIEPYLKDLQKLAKKQDESKVSFAYNIQKSEQIINPHKQTCLQVYNKIRAFYDFPMAILIYKGKRIKIHKASFDFIKERSNEVLFVKDKKLYLSCLDGSVCIEILQPENKAKMNSTSFINGYLKY